MREEEKVGQRTLLDVLNAELEYLNSQVSLESDRRNLVVAAYTVLGAMGRLDAAWIGAAAYVYDPVVHYKEVRRKWLGLSITHSDGRREDYRGQAHRPRPGRARPPPNRPVCPGIRATRLPRMAASVALQHIFGLGTRRAIGDGGASAGGSDGGWAVDPLKAKPLRSTSKVRPLARADSALRPRI